MRIAMVGTRGVPARYGGYETAVEEIGSRLVERGHDVTVYCRGTRATIPKEYLGMKLVWLPSVPLKAAETLSHTALSVSHMLFRRRPEVAFIFSAVNSPFLPLLRARRIPSAVNVDGLQWKRAKWGARGQKFFHKTEEHAVRWGDAIISDAAGIADYYRKEFDLETEVIAYGAPILRSVGTDRLSELGLIKDEFHLVVARFQPDNHVDVIVDGYRRSNAKNPLIVVGDAPYAAAHTQRIRQLAASDPRIHFLGAVYDQAVLDQLYASARTYIHGHSVGGTNPSLLRAMGAGTAVIAWDVIFNHEVAGNDGIFFDTSEGLAEILDNLEANATWTAASGRALQLRAEKNYDWDVITDSYELLSTRLIAGFSTASRTHPRVKGLDEPERARPINPIVRDYEQLDHSPSLIEGEGG